MCAEGMVYDLKGCFFTRGFLSDVAFKYFEGMRLWVE
jgi:hypothetical protein